MKITYYGTSASEGWPALFCECEACTKARKLRGKNIRTRNQSLIDETLLIDFCPDTNYHVLEYGLNLKKVKTLLVTHSHHDHLFASDICMRKPVFSDIKKGIMTVYGDDYVCAQYYEAAKHFPGIEDYVVFKNARAFHPFTTEDGYDVVPLKADHDPPLSLIYAISKDNKSILYAHDTGLLPEETCAYIQGMHFDLVSLDCTALTRNWESGHMGFNGVKKTRKWLLNNGIIDQDAIVVLSHFAHFKDYTHEMICEKMEPQGFVVAYDGMQIEF